MSPETMLIDEIVRGNLRDNREYVVGYADLRGLLAGQYSKYTSGILIGQRLDDVIIDSIESGPNSAYHDLYNTTNRELSELASRLSQDLKEKNIDALAVAPTLTDADRTESYNRTLKLDLSHKMVATRAGLGWIGKSALLITRKFGPRVRLVSVLLDHPFGGSQEPVLKSECGSCDLCVRKCPAKALSGKNWDITVKREYILDAFRCREKCRELGESNVGQGVRLCGICVSLCPVGKGGRRGSEDQMDDPSRQI